MQCTACNALASCHCPLLQIHHHTHSDAFLNESSTPILARATKNSKRWSIMTFLLSRQSFICSICNSADGCKQSQVSPFAISKHPSKNSWVCICMRAPLSVKSIPPCRQGTALEFSRHKTDRKGNELLDIGACASSGVSQCRQLGCSTHAALHDDAMVHPDWVQHSQHSALEALRTNQCHLQ